MKRINVILVVVCLLLSVLSLSASAATFASGTYVEKINASGSLLADNVKAIASNAFNIDVTATAKTGISLNAGTTEINDANVDSLVSFKAGTSTLTFANNLASYFTVSGTIYGDTAIITFADKSANDREIYRVTSTINTATDTDISGKVSVVSNAKKYNLSPATVSATISRRNATVCSLTIGSRLYAVNDEYDMAGLAVIRGMIQHHNGITTDYAYSDTNTITGLLPGESVYLEAALLAEKDSEYYVFNGWVDGNGQLLSTSRVVKIQMDGTSWSLFASYILAKPHITVFPEELKMTYKQTAQLETVPNAVRLESSNPRAVRVDSDTGIVEAIGAGKATITAYSADGATATCEVTARYTFVQLLIRIFLFGWIWY